MRSLLLLPLAMVLNLNMIFFDSPAVPEFHGSVDTTLADIRASYPILHWFLYSCLLFVTAILINRMTIIHRLSNVITLYPGLLFLVLASAFPLFAVVSSISISILFQVLMLSNLMYTNARTGATGKVFNAGIYLGLMGSVFLPQLLYLVLVLIGINILTAIKQRSVLNLLNGMMLPFYLGGLYFLIRELPLDTLSSYYQGQIGFANFRLPSLLSEWLTLGLIAVLLMLVLFTYNQAISKKSIQSIRKITILAYTLLASLIIYFFSGKASLHCLMLLLPAMGFFISEAMLRMKKESSAELLFLLLIMLCIIMPFVA